MADGFEAIVKVVAWGVPALCIILGFFGYMWGVTLTSFGGDGGTKGLGVLLIIIGIGLYCLELFLAYKD
jgi:hypothetical protein